MGHLLERILIVCMGGLSWGCASKDSGTAAVDTSGSAQVAADSGVSWGQSSFWISELLGNAQSTDPSQATVESTTTVKVWPASCAHRSRTSATSFDVTLTDCSGPFGLRKVNGKMSITFTAGASGSLAASVTSVGLTVDGKTASFQATANGTQTDGNRAWSVNSTWTRISSDGTTVVHTGAYTSTRDKTTDCLTSTGTSTTTKGEKSVTATVSSYKVCPDASGTGNACPTGTWNLVFAPGGASATMTFDGTANATLSTSSETKSIPLVCGT